MNEVSLYPLREAVKVAQYNYGIWAGIFMGLRVTELGRTQRKIMANKIGRRRRRRNVCVRP